MDFTGKRVQHNAWGEGVIVLDDGNHIEVQFPNRSKLVRFSSPACFDKFLTLLEPDAAAASRDALAERERAEAAQAREALKRRMEIQRKSTRRKKPEEHPFYPNVEAFFDAQTRDLEAEMAQLRKQGGKRVHIYNGERIERHGGKYVYAFETEAELNMPDGVGITLWRESKSFLATLLSSEESHIYIATEEDLGESIAQMEFTSETWRLVGFLIDRLAELREMPGSIVSSLILRGPEQIRPGKKIITGQENAIEMAQRQPVTFIWGPPGTGKTHTLAKIVLAQVGRGKRVLMLSHSNVSVDGAALRVVREALNPWPGEFVRCGYPREKEVREHPWLSAYNFVIRNHQDLLKKREELLAMKRRLPSADAGVLKINRELGQLRSQLADEEVRAVKQAPFVATTISKAIADKTIYGDRFDMVILDEASMAYIPQIVFAASLARERFVCIGDFAQLPPIVQSGNDSSLNVDIFRHCGIVEAVERDCGHEWLCMLNVQRRMHPKIADFVSGWMYSGLLSSAEGMEEQRDAIARCEPFAGHAMALADLSGTLRQHRTDKVVGRRMNFSSDVLANFAGLLDASQEICKCRWRKRHRLTRRCSVRWCLKRMPEDSG